MNTVEERTTNAMRVIEDRSMDGIEQVRVPIVWLTQDLVDDEYCEVRASLRLAPVARDDGFREDFAPGALDRAIVGRDQHAVAREAYEVASCLFGNPRLLIASTGAGTLTLVEQEDRGELGYRARIPAEPYGEILARTLRDDPAARLILRVTDDSWGEDENGRAVRTIHRLTLYSVALGVGY